MLHGLVDWCAGLLVSFLRFWASWRVWMRMILDQELLWANVSISHLSQKPQCGGSVLETVIDGNERQKAEPPHFYFSER